MPDLKSARSLWDRRQGLIAVLAVTAIGVHLFLRFATAAGEFAANIPLWVALIVGGTPLVAELAIKLFQRKFGSDMLAGISIVTSVILGEYLAGTLVVLMLSGGEALESYAVRSASSVLSALAKRMPSVAHRQAGQETRDIAIDEVRIGDQLLVLPHEICPVDGTVVAGHGVMDESYLTGEPYMLSKTPGSTVLSGAINGHAALTITADKLPIDSRYARIMQVMRDSEQSRPRLRRLGDQLGAWYTPLAVGMASVAWLASGDSRRFLAVLVTATPCPLLIAIPVAIIGSISLAARRGIIVKDPAALEKIDTCRTAIFDKTGTLTYGRPKLTEQLLADGFSQLEVLGLVASLERYSKHPLAEAIMATATAAGATVAEATQISEPPGQGMQGVVNGRTVRITSRKQLQRDRPDLAAAVPPIVSGMECQVLIDERYAGTYRFRDEPRKEGAKFVHHLGPNHHFQKVMLVSGDREGEVRYLAEKVGITEIFAGQSPEDKLAIVRAETAKANTVFLGDGINDAPALMAATVGIAIGQNSDVTTEAASVIIMDSSLAKIDEFMHISRRMRQIALQSAVGGITLSLAAMLLAAFGLLSPVAGAVTQEGIDVIAVLNALRASWPPKSLRDF